MSGNINKNTFVGLTYHELSQEGFGLPSIHSMKFASEQDIWKNNLVIRATDKVKQFAVKKKLDYDIEVDKNDTKSVIKALLALRGYNDLSDDVIEKAKKFISFKRINGVTIAIAKMSYTTSQVFGVGLLTILSSAVVGAGLGLTLGPLSIPGAVILSSITIANIGKSILNKSASKNASKYEGVFVSWAVLGHKGTSLDDLGSITLKQFCNGIITGSGKSKKSVEDLESDEVSMTDLVENETTVEEDAGKDSEVTDINISQDDSTHNEEASAGGVLTGDNKDELEVKETSEEALGITDYDLYSEDEYKSLEGVFDPDDFE